MAINRKKTKGRSDGERFAGVPHAVMNHPDWLKLTGNAIRLLLELVRQYNGKNNGDLTAAWSIIKVRGFKNQNTLGAALRCLIDNGMLVRTREGFYQPNKRCALYAITWRRIDECKGKHLDIGPTTAPLRCFAIENKLPSTKTVASDYRNSSDKAKSEQVF